MFFFLPEHLKVLLLYQSITSQVHTQINIMSKALEEINTQISIMSKVLEDINNQINNMSKTLEDPNIQIDIQPRMNMGRKLEKLKIKTEMEIKMKNIIGEDFLGKRTKKILMLVYRQQEYQVIHLHNINFDSNWMKNWD